MMDYTPPATRKYYVTAVDYSGFSNVPEVHIFARDEAGKRYVFIDSTFKPRFYAPHAEVMDYKLHDTKGVTMPETLEPYHLPAVDKTVVSEIFVNMPRDVRKAREGYSHTYQSDILFPILWAISKGIKSWFIIENGCIKPIIYDKQGPLKIGYVDIETEVGPVFSPPERPDSMIISVVMATNWASDPEEKAKFFTFKARDEFEEANVLTLVAQKIDEEDLDILTSYNNFDFPYMFNRAKRKGISMRACSPMRYYRASLNERLIPPRWDTHIAGRNYIDTWQAYKRFFQGKNFDSEKLDDRVHQDCGWAPDGFNYAMMLRTNADAVLKHNIHHVRSLMKLERFHQLIPYLTNFRDLAGCPFKDTVAASKMFDVLMMRAFKDKFILPSKVYGRTEDEAFEGALVKAPPGEGRFGPWIIIFDFSAMYPTLIQRYNMSIETLVGRLLKAQVDFEKMYAVDMKDGTYICFWREPYGVLPGVIVDLGIMRSKAKAKLEIATPGTDDYKRAWNEQYGMKQTINAGAYGLNAYVNYRLYSPLIAEATTAAGRLAITKMIEIIGEHFQYDTLSGDTDSSFELVTGLATLDEAIVKGEEMQTFINDFWKQDAKESGSKYFMKVSLEKIARRIIYMKKTSSDDAAKKRYALLIEWQDGKKQRKLEIKGMEAKRRDSALITRDLQIKIIEAALEGRDEDIGKILISIQQKFRMIPIEEIGIPVSLNKDLDQFKNAASSKKSLMVSNAAFDQHWVAGERGYKYHTTRNQKVFIAGKILESDICCVKKDDHGKVQLPSGVLIDYDMMYEKTVVAKTKKLLSACGMGDAILKINWNPVTGKIIRQKILGEF